MPTHRSMLTREGKERLEHEFEELRSKRRPELRQRLQKALEATHGDSAGLTQYRDAQWEQARVEGRITELERLLAEAELIEAPPAHEMVGPGSMVLVRHEEDSERHTLVGPAEADPRHGRISVESPVGRALLGHRPGELVEVPTPAGPRRLEVLAVE